MRNAAIAISAWTMWVLGTAVLGMPLDSVPTYYWSHIPGCIHQINPRASCLRLLDEINVAWRRYHTLPILLMIVAGYVAVGAILVIGRRRVPHLERGVGPRGRAHRC